MSQFTLTLEEDAIITDALKAKATQYAAMFGVADPALEALIAKLEGYNPVVESAPVATPVVEPEVVVETPEEVVAEEAADEDEAE
jgi:hypothetical protein